MDKKLQKEVFEQLDEIHSSLLDSEKFMPYNFNAIIVWGIISVLLFLFAGYFFEMSNLNGIIYLTLLLGIGTATEYIFTKRENRKYEIKRLTNLQNFIHSIFAFSIIFGILFTLVLVSVKAISYIPLLWMFVISFANYITGYSVNGKIMKKFGSYTLMLTYLLLTITIMLEANKLSLIINNIAAIMTLGFGHIYVGIKLKYTCTKDNICV